MMGWRRRVCFHSTAAIAAASAAAPRAAPVLERRSVLKLLQQLASRRRGSWLNSSNGFHQPFYCTHQRANVSSSSSSSSLVENELPFPRRFCAKCYQPLKQGNEEKDEEQDASVHCPHCSKRLYCSLRCQRDDWENGVHRHYCGQSGEINVDYEMRMVDPAVGVGLFALRPFAKNEIILVESPILTESKHLPDGKKERSLTISPSAMTAVAAMHPVHGTLEEKMDHSAMELNDETMAGLFLTIGMANHDCLGNADHLFLDDWNVRLLVASQTIPVGEEIRFFYIEPSVPRLERKRKLWKRYGFECTCELCRSPHDTNALEPQIQEAYHCNERLEMLVENSQVEQALVEGRRLLELFDNMTVPESTKSYIYVYLAMFRAAIQHSDTVAMGVQFLKRARQSYVRYTHTDQTLECLRMTELIQNPQRHDDYLKLER